MTAHGEAPSPTTGSHGPVERLWTRGLALAAGLALARALVVWSLGFHHTLSDQHSFRQAQTALSARTILEGGPTLLYDVPIFGPPWALPQEFPLYQWLTALAARWGLPLIEAGRAVSLLWFGLALAGIWAVLGRLGVERGGRLAILTAVLCAPIHLFWPRTVMIETCALALAVWYAYCALGAASARRAPGELAAGGALGALAMAVKLTTFLPYRALAAVCPALAAARDRALWRAAAVRGGVLVATPLVVGAVWTAVANRTRSANPLLELFYGPHAVAEWVFGSPAERWSAALWSAVGERMLPDALGSAAVLAAVLGVAAVTRLYRRHALAAGGLFVLSLLLFPRLHQVHNYYQTENALFLCAACGFVAWGAIRQDGAGARRAAGAALLIVLAAAGEARWRSVYLPSVGGDNQAPLAIAAQVVRSTAPDQLIVVRGDDWSSEIPFYSARRAILDREFPADLLRERIRAAAPARVGDVLLCYGARGEARRLSPADQVAAVAQRYGIAVAEAVDDGQCLHYLPAEPTFAPPATSLPSAPSTASP